MKKHAQKRKRPAASSVTSVTKHTTKTMKKKKKKKTDEINKFFSQFIFGPTAFQPLDSVVRADNAIPAQITLDMGGGRQYIVDINARTQTNAMTGFSRPCQRIAAGGWYSFDIYYSPKKKNEANMFHPHI